MAISINALENGIITKKPLALGVQTVTFIGMKWSIDRKAETVKGVNVEIAEGASLYIPIFDEDNSYQMNYFVRQLGKEGEPWNADKFTADCKGTKLKIYRYRTEDGKYINTSFNPSDAVEQKNSTLAMRI